MNKKILKFLICIAVFAFLFLIISCSKKKNQEFNETDYTQFVNPFIGTGGVGHTFPGATTPFGFIQLSPRTGNREWDYVAGYQYNDSILYGFSHNHLSGGGGVGLGDVLILPYSNNSIYQNGGVLFSKDEEFASPGYYSVKLLKDDILVELSATGRTGIHKYTFNKKGTYHISVDINEIIEGWWYEKSISQVDKATINIEDNKTLTGYLKTKLRGYRESYFALQLSKPFESATYSDSTKRKLILNYSLSNNDSVEVRISISTVSVESAKNNLLVEANNKTFSEIKGESKNNWNKHLAKVQITGSEKKKEIFYTALYHLIIQPNNIADVDGLYRGGDREIHISPTKKMYSTFAFWDTFRAAHPLYTILYPEETGEFVASLVRYYEETGNLPVWGYWGGDSYTMIGNHSVPVIVDAYLKGITGFNKDKAYEAIKETLTKDHWKNKEEAAGRQWSSLSWSVYDHYGFHPSDIIFGESVSRTLEDAFDAWCASLMADTLGKNEDYELFNRRAGFYKNIFDSGTLFMRGRNSDSSWVEPFDPFLISHVQSSGGDYTEGNAWHWIWSVQHDIDGLIQLFGSKELFAKKLDTLFSLPPVIIGEGSTDDISGLIGQYVHGNEPSHHVAYLYNYADQPHRTQELINRIKTELYDNKPDGLAGNDDFGQMSAWYIFSTLGFYPVNPASGIYDIGIPSVEYASVNLNGKAFNIRVKNFSPENRYVSSVTLNGKPIDNYKISHKEIMEGGELVFELSH